MGYITFRSITTSADLGSQVMQYWALSAVANANNLQIVFPQSMSNKGWGYKFSELLDIKLDLRPDEFFNNFIPLTMDRELLVDPKLFNLDSTKNYSIEDLFFYCNYWYPKYSYLIDDIKWNQKYYQKALDIFETLKKLNKELVSIHVRRGDYLLHDHFCKLDNRYYEEALQDFIPDIEKYHFLVFSNDIE